MIPRVIHYCWFGRSEKSDLIKKCIDSWRQFCPDFEIIEWNEDNFNINDSIQYVREAYHSKKWAFVSDYVRYYVLNKFGGVYMDTDVELLKPIDSFLDNKFLALEKFDSIATGLIMGCEKNDGYCRWMLESYSKDKFILDSGELNTYTVCERTTKYFLDKGFITENILQTVDGFQIYPTEYFCPKDPITFNLNVTANTVSVHHYGASWCTEEQKQYFMLRAEYAKKYPYAIASLIAYFKSKKQHYGFSKAFIMTIKKVLKKSKGK